MTTSPASSVAQSPPAAPQSPPPPSDAGGGQDFSQVLNQTQSAQRPANDPPPPTSPQPATGPRTTADKKSAKTDNNTGRKSGIKKTDDPLEHDSQTDPSDVAILTGLPGDGSTDGHADGGKPPEKQTKNKATDLAPTDKSNDAQNTVAIQTAPVGELKAPAPAKGVAAKEPDSRDAKVIPAHSTPSPASSADPKPLSADSLDGTEPTTSAPPNKGAPGSGKPGNGKASPVSTTTAASGVDPSTAIASTTAGAVTNNPAEVDDITLDPNANSAPVVPGDHAAAKAIASLTTDNFSTPIVSNSNSTHSSTGSAFALPTPATELPAETQFGQTNYPQIVSAVHGQLLPGGGSMQIRLDPPELGAVHINVQMRDGAMTATFEASSDQAARLLTHSLGDLKMALESQGVNVEAIHVKQTTTPASTRSSSQDSQQQQNSSSDDNNARREQQRQQMLRRMWQRLSGGDPLDMVA